MYCIGLNNWRFQMLLQDNVLDIWVILYFNVIYLYPCYRATLKNTTVICVPCINIIICYFGFMYLGRNSEQLHVLQHATCVANNNTRRHLTDSPHTSVS